MNKSLSEFLEGLMGCPIQNMVPVSGGDISSAYQISAGSDQYFCKHHDGPEALSMLEAEMEGLNAIRETAVIKAPQVYYCQSWEAGAVLIMEFVRSKRPRDTEMALLGKQLAQMHLGEARSFGWHSSNFIGSLAQSNTKMDRWPEFYVSERLVPQLKMARDRQFLSSDEIPSHDRMIGILEELCPDTTPSLLHGDLWGGNYLIAEDGTPFLIDPAVHYGHHEVDIAMSQLFGGFGDAFYRAYERDLPGDALSADRIKVYQLYYLLVHLNLFGRSYYASVNSILKQYFR